jgi:hypothetical protein
MTELFDTLLHLPEVFHRIAAATATAAKMGSTPACWDRSSALVGIDRRN